MRGIGLCLVGIGALMSGGPLLGGGGKEATDNVLKSIQGTWQFVAHEMNGKPTPREEVAKLKITFTGNKWTVREDGKVVQAGTHKFDPAKKPAQVDAVVTEGEGKGTTMLGIYELKGNKMRVCFDPQGKERPTSFTAKTGQFLAIVQREKKE
jgi:uncharacterized protein (TIGR03067 family)